MVKIMIVNYVFRIFFIFAITVSAIHFNNPKLLWWYMLPAFCGLSIKDKEGADNG